MAGEEDREIISSEDEIEVAPYFQSPELPPNRRDIRQKGNACNNRPVSTASSSSATSFCALAIPLPDTGCKSFVVHAVYGLGYFRKYCGIHFAKKPECLKTLEKMIGDSKGALWSKQLCLDTRAECEKQFREELGFEEYVFCIFSYFQWP